MAKQLVAAVVLLALAVVVRGDDAQAEKLRREITELRAKLSAKEAELSRIVPVTSTGPLNPGSAKLGHAGRLCLTEGDGASVHIEQIIDGQSLLAKVSYINGGETRVILAVPTRGKVDGVGDPELSQLTWRVVDTKRHGSRTVFVLERHEPAKK